MGKVVAVIFYIIAFGILIYIFATQGVVYAILGVLLMILIGLIGRKRE